MANHIYKGVLIHKDKVGKHLIGYVGLAHWCILETRTLIEGDYPEMSKTETIYFFTLREAKQYIDSFDHD